jgi:anti-sigma B factor antagonist
MTDRFGVTVTTGGEMPVVELRGQVDRDAEAELLDGFERAATGATAIALDFGPTDYINSTGLAVLVQLLARARAAGCEVHAWGLSDHYREIFEITRLADFVTLHGERPAA